MGSDGDQVEAGKKPASRPPGAAEDPGKPARSGTGAVPAAGEEPAGRARLVSLAAAIRAAGIEGDLAAGLAGREISDEVFKLLMTALRGLDEDLRLIMDEIRAITYAKQALREILKDLGRWISRELAARGDAGGAVTGASPGGLFRVGDRGVEFRVPRPDTESADLVSETATTYDPGDELTVRGLKVLLDEMKSELDSMNEMSEMTSLRLQMTMDRRSKFVSTLSNIMKKISTTQDLLVQNLK